MQTRIRKSRCSQVDGRFRKSKIASFCCGKIAFLFFIFFNIHSCAHQGPGKSQFTIDQKKQLLEESLHRVCLSGTGKGRLIFLSGRYSFSYESLLESKNQNWSLGLDVPMLGQELFKLSYQNADKGIIQVSGNFYKRLKSDASQESNVRYQLELLDSYLLGYSKFLKWFEMSRSNRDFFLKSCTDFDHKEISGQCLFWDNVLSWKVEGEKFTLSFPLKNEDRFVFEAINLVDKNRQHFKMFLKEKNKPIYNQDSLQIELYQSSCEE